MAQVNSHYCFLLTGFCIGLAYSSTTPTCIDPNGKAVDWFSAYKMPKMRHTTWRAMQSGDALVYQDSKTSGKWQRLDIPITNAKNPVGLTIAPLYNRKISSSLLYVLYNDQPPPDRQSPYNSGHAKGLIIFNRQGGIWLIHSVPGFPPRPNFEGSYEYPSSGHRNGQSILCLTLPASELEKVAKQLYYGNAYVYDKNIEKSMMTSSRPFLALLMNEGGNSKRSTAPHYSTLELTTSDGASFISFAKNSKFKKDLYADNVALELKTSLFVEGWRNGKGNIDSNCAVTYQVMNIESIHFNVPTDLDHDIQFETTLDHSKWAVSADETKPWVCIGDINRQYGQFNRGGGTVCRRDKLMWRSYHDLVEGVESCHFHQTTSSIPRQTSSIKLDDIDFENILGIAFFFVIAVLTFLGLMPFLTNR